MATKAIPKRVTKTVSSLQTELQIETGDEATSLSLEEIETDENGFPVWDTALKEIETADDTALKEIETADDEDIHIIGSKCSCKDSKRQSLRDSRVDPG